VKPSAARKLAAALTSGAGLSGFLAEVRWEAPLAGAPGHHRIVFSGGAQGEHSLAVGVSSEARVRAHWDGYVGRPAPAAKPSKESLTPTTTHDDGRFVRTAIVLDPSTGVSSVDLVTPDGVLLARVNFVPSRVEGESLIVDVIDVSGRYETKRALTFSPTERRQVDVPEGGSLVSVDFRRAPKADRAEGVPLVEVLAGSDLLDARVARAIAKAVRS